MEIPINEHNPGCSEKGPGRTKKNKWPWSSLSSFGHTKKIENSDNVCSRPVFVVAAVFAYLYIPYLHKPKQIAQPVVVQPPVPAKPAQAAVIEKTRCLSDAERQTRSHRYEDRDCSRSKNCYFFPGEEERQGLLNQSAHRMQWVDLWGWLKRKQTMQVTDNMYNEALREQQSGRTREAKTIYKTNIDKNSQVI